MMDYMSNNIDSRWLFHTNEESNESNLSRLSMINHISPAALKETHFFLLSIILCFQMMASWRK